MPYSFRDSLLFIVSVETTLYRHNTNDMKTRNRMRWIIWLAVLPFLMQYGCQKGCTGDPPTPAEALVAGFIDTWFPGREIAERRTSDDGITVVTLCCGTQLTFDAAGAWCRIEDRKAPLPTGIVAGPIGDYLKEHYPSENILLLQRDGEGYEVGLESKVKLRFNLAQLFIAVEPWKTVDTEIEL